MSRENKEHKTQSIKMDGQGLTSGDLRLLMRMLPDCCCAKCKHWLKLAFPRWPKEEVHFDESLLRELSYLSTLYTQVDWDGECRRFPPKVVPPDVRPSNRGYQWPVTSCGGYCGEFAPRDQPTR